MGVRVPSSSEDADRDSTSASRSDTDTGFASQLEREELGSAWRLFTRSAMCYVSGRVARPFKKVLRPIPFAYYDDGCVGAFTEFGSSVAVVARYEWEHVIDGVETAGRMQEALGMGVVMGKSVGGEGGEECGGDGWGV